MSQTLKQKFFSEVRFFLGLFSFLLAMMTLVWGHFKIPSESMLPTLEVGDHLYVSKFAYGYSRHSLPFMLHKLPLPDGQIFSRSPKRGDVVVFRNPKNGIIMIKRVVGLPGDQVQVIGGKLHLNGAVIQRTPVTNYIYREHRGRAVGVDVYSETLPGEEKNHLIYEQNDQKYLDNTELFDIPEGHFFFMGDNRDNSTDSRAVEGPGMVPQDHLIGRADLLMFSFKRCKEEADMRCPETPRFAKGL
ncbi:signal peptidase I [Litorimonas taeanensis]|uniref:signal peptidase I n=1 Tax=Litorimonas taeanensis TaxID=568099 RepID=UPI001472B8A5|nr:signal peptidase I [Litorimonas taeanensis]